MDLDWACFEEKIHINNCRTSTCTAKDKRKRGRPKGNLQNTEEKGKGQQRFLRTGLKQQELHRTGKTRRCVLYVTRGAYSQQGEGTKSSKSLSLYSTFHLIQYCLIEYFG
jgi:hypothetical protein